ncbi:YqgE/AlgH family protein [Mycobacterium sp. KBS0706]|jgi:putative transcriptional regulator|uniref:YqgE/AlgH family protein n=1 Tax=Mycobacterium sp. KBS0706 TaxID=2578109 RepID=UPI00110FD7D6|nr:YqgE/AlgH family protein [Mycobacterium sp. KBS0706]TSD83819.1 YqgE/AlgH family protein [Mycobacterium sp. KBS0706]
MRRAKTSKGAKVPADGSYLAGQLLIAMPTLVAPPFARTVIYLCAHNDQGAMGLVVNKPLSSIDFPTLLDQLGIPHGDMLGSTRVQFGGPVESGRGFVLHSTDYRAEKTVVVGEVAVTSTLEVLQAIAGGTGPSRHLLALGYAGWSAGQLDAEIQANGWLNVPCDSDILFGEDLSVKWERAIAKLGIDPMMLSGEAGHA